MISYDEAIEIADGYIWYQDEANALKGRVRKHGKFVSEDAARSHLSTSKVSGCDNVARLEDVTEEEHRRHREVKDINMVTSEESRVAGGKKEIEVECLKELPRFFPRK